MWRIVACVALRVRHKVLMNERRESLPQLRSGSTAVTGDRGVSKRVADLGRRPSLPAALDPIGRGFSIMGHVIADALFECVDA